MVTVCFTHTHTHTRETEREKEREGQRGKQSERERDRKRDSRDKWCVMCAIYAAVQIFWTPLCTAPKLVILWVLCKSHCLVCTHPAGLKHIPTRQL